MRQLPIRTSSLTLRHFVADDAALLQRLNAEASTRHWLPSHVYADLAQAKSAVAYLIGCYTSPGDAKRGPYVLAVELQRSRELLGHVGFSPLDDDVEVSYAIAESARGHGYAAEALAAACNWAADAFALPSVTAVTAAANAASRRVLDRAGFLHRRDAAMRFQGTEQQVSRYVWPRRRQMNFGTDVTTRAAGPEDIEFLAGLRMRTVHEHIVRAGTVLTLEQHRRRASANLDSCTLFEIARRPIGMMKVIRSDSEWDLDQFQLEPECQRQGLGSDILRQLQATARTAGVRLTLKVLKVNPALRLYQRLGFKIVGEEEAIYAMQSEA
jgi:RimJ/RimL family protein N-acetyltransferase